MEQGACLWHRLHDGLWAKIRSLADFPEVWPLTDEAADLAIELRQVLFGKRRHVYRILYTFDGTTIHVHRVRHAAQDRLSSHSSRFGLNLMPQPEAAEVSATSGFLPSNAAFTAASRCFAFGSPGGILSSIEPM